MAFRRNLKRKSAEKYDEENEGFVFPLDELNQDILERVLSWLPTSTFLRLTSVSKRWKSAATSPVFHHACSLIPSRHPWFYMVDSSQDVNKNQHSFVYDSSEKNWKKMVISSLSNFIPVAASGGLLCFHNGENSEFLVTNPVTSSCRKLPLLDSTNTLCAIGMVSTQVSYNKNNVSNMVPQVGSGEDRVSYSLILISGEPQNLSFRVYNSVTNHWEESAVLSRKPAQSESSDEEMVYFLSKCGNVVATEIQKTPCKQYSSIITTNEDGKQILCFLNSSGKVVVCNLDEKCFFEYPRLLPLHHEYSIDLVECGGELLAVVLSEFLETASLRVWRFDEKEWTWIQICAMPAAISHEFYGKKVDINCAGAGEQIFVCVSGSGDDESCRYFLCNLVGNEWTELPDCRVDGFSRKFSCAFSFQPRIEASV